MQRARRRADGTYNHQEHTSGESRNEYGMSFIPEHITTFDGASTDASTGEAIPAVARRLAAMRSARVFWSGSYKVPAILDRGRVTFNGLGRGTVVGYFVEHGWLGLEIRLDKQPKWHREQNGAKATALVFGLEFRPDADASLGGFDARCEACGSAKRADSACSCARADADRS